MPDNITKYSESFKIRANEVNQEKKATLGAICSLFQEVAVNHALKLNFDITQLNEQNLTWVLHRMDINIDRFPDWRETIIIETWPAAGDALRAYRDYRILDASGKQIGCCLSYWMMMNLNTRRPTRMPKEVLDMRLKEFDHVLPVKTDRVKPFENPDTESTFTVRNSDLDMNNHVNNARYVEWMLESLEIEQKNKITTLDVMFMKESVAGDTVISQCKSTANDSYKHQLKNQNGDTLLIAKSG
ncbi:acyl-[acyl-carrier-protein] thioesterase [Gracilimonas sp.]|uniref:acyl-[acyl-carrier-protein] thioesterase n=1 Tax=Gracilimonas sp. TaxID=1974203 RepID=UPI002871B8F2|nr:thioesterase [Gracilimonas sp.]